MIAHIYSNFHYYLEHADVRAAVVCFGIVFALLVSIKWAIWARADLFKSLVFILSLSFYYTVLLLITMLGRSPGEQNEWSSIWRSAYLMCQGNVSVIYDVVFNVILFIPYGFMLSIIMKKGKGILLVITTSTLIEITQLFTTRGLFEVSDIIANTLGGLIGVGIHHLLLYVYRRIVQTKCEI